MSVQLIEQAKLVIVTCLNSRLQILIQQILHNLRASFALGIFTKTSFRNTSHSETTFCSVKRCFLGPFYSSLFFLSAGFILTVRTRKSAFGPLYIILYYYYI